MPRTSAASVRAHARGHRALRALAHAVEHAGEPAPPAAGRPRPVQLELGRDPAPAQVGVEVEGRVARVARRGGGARPQLAQAAGQRELVADLERARKAAPPRGAREEAGAAQVGAAARHGDLHLGGRAKGARTGGCEQVRPQRNVLAVADPVREAVDRGQPQVADQGPRRAAAPRRTRASRGARSRRGRAAISRHRRAARATGGDSAQAEPAGEARHRDLPGPARAERERGRAAAHGCSASCSVAKRFSPIPSTSRSSPSDRKPPCVVRYSTIRWASVGPMPSSWSSCSTVAAPRLSLGTPAAPRTAREPGAEPGAAPGPPSAASLPAPARSPAARLPASPRG